MPDNPLEQARFDHVDGEGNLVFIAAGRRFSVAMDDTLERAVLEAKQLASESRLRARQPRAGESLPLSQIQSLIRAGATPAQVAQRYALGEALVRRFAAPVETEKQYAVEQFLSVPAPKDSRARTVAELIERTLAAALVDMSALHWQATRRGLEPWHITARFETSEHDVHAEWTWNMRDNTVTCLNTAAKKLLGEQNLGSAGGQRRADTGFSFPSESADAIRSVRIEREVSRWDPPRALAPSAPANVGAASGEASDGGGAGTQPQDARPVPTEGLALHPDPHPYPDASDAGAQATPLPLSETAPAMTSAMGSDARPDTHADAGASFPSDTGATPAPDASEATIPVDDPDGERRDAPEAHRSPKRRSGRSAMPSWDEILFGE